jgi:hypothetical protein
MVMISNKVKQRILIISNKVKQALFYTDLSIVIHNEVKHSEKNPPNHLPMPLLIYHSYLLARQ